LNPVTAMIAGQTPEPTLDSDTLRVVVARLAQAASHEINNPLTVISGYLQRLQRRPGCLCAEHVAAMLDSVHRIRDVVSALGEVRSLDLDPRWRDLAPMLDLRLRQRRRRPSARRRP
jgi:signal transduction histidine kinase